MTAPLGFDEIERALAAGGSSVHAAEAHGCLCGALCARRVYLPSEWLEEILADPADDDALAMIAGPLGELYARSGADLAGTDLEFSPLLPDDEVFIQQRIEALAEWCQGFLYGFGAAGTLPRAALSDDVTEFLTDLAELTRVDTVDTSAAEAEEEAYAELVEYLRVGVQLVYDQLEGARVSQPTSDSQH
jgi:uncharacterized protein YgfB (UPF0149 family)